jgi:hypothetical protein
MATKSPHPGAGRGGGEGGEFDRPLSHQLVQEWQNLKDKFKDEDRYESGK